MSADLTVPPPMPEPRNYWTPKPKSGLPDNLACWSPNPGPHPQWDVDRYIDIDEVEGRDAIWAERIASLQARLDAAERALRTCIDYFDDNWRNIAGADADIARAEAIAATQEKP